MAVCASVTELVAVQAMLAEAMYTAITLHTVSALLLGGCAVALFGRRAGHTLPGVLLVCLFAPMVGGIGVVASGLSALRRERFRPTGRRGPVTARARHAAVWSQPSGSGPELAESADRQDTLRLPAL